MYDRQLATRKFLFTAHKLKLFNLKSVFASLTAYQKACDWIAGKYEP
jgi:hypothetical protein